MSRPLTVAVLAEGAGFAVAFPLGYATVGLVLGLRRPANPIGWLFATSGLIWSLTIRSARGSTSSSWRTGRCRWRPSWPP
jgi:hypothetical protein